MIPLDVAINLIQRCTELELAILLNLILLGGKHRHKWIRKSLADLLKASSATSIELSCALRALESKGLIESRTPEGSESGQIKIYRAVWKNFLPPAKVAA